MTEKTINPVCNACGESGINKFYKKKRTRVRKDGSIYTYRGYYSNCKKCVNRHNMATIHKYSDWYKAYRKNNKEKINSKTRAWYKKQKQLWIDILVGYGIVLKCSECGYDRSFAALDFHHIDPAEKDPTVLFHNWMGKAPTPERVSVAIEEIKKCVVLCSNCHRDLHAVYDFNLKRILKGSD